MSREGSSKLDRAISGIFGKTSKSTKDLVNLAKDYPTSSEDYDLIEDCGRGVSATVYRSLCKPLHEVVAVKKMNLESMNCDLDEIIHEAQLMKNYNHPNVLPLYTSFVSGQDLWMVMPFISGGSVLHIIKYAYPEGLDEIVIATIMREVLKAIDYVHRQGGIHRDIKAGNILVDKDGKVYLADFGVATSLERAGSWSQDKSNRMTFVGTPCWMAPEVMEQTAGYDNAADIWSFGISMLEMAHGHAPFAKFPPMKVLLMTLQNPPPTLDDKGKKHFSKAMRDVVSKCLQKDPRLRPPASQLLEHKFFKQARDAEFLSKHLMLGLPSLGDRVQEIRQGRAATNSKDNERNFVQSQEEYKKGVSSWNFDVAALKAQADLEDDEPLLPSISENDEKEDMTLSGISALQAAEFVATTSEPSGLSVFATKAGQAEAVGKGAQVNIDLETLLASQDHVPGTGDAPPSPVGATRAISREESNHVLGSILSPTLSTVAQKKGRFSVYEAGDEPPPMSPQQGAPALAGRELELSLNFGSQRVSEDGTKREPSASETLNTEDTVSVEPKKKGRFTVIENGGVTKTQSVVNLADAAKRPLSSDISFSGKPPVAPSPSTPSAQALLPRLQELMDQASQHHAALQKIVFAVQESDRMGKSSALLLRPLSAKVLHDSIPASESDNIEELRSTVESLRTRISELETENFRLRSRNRELGDVVRGSEGGSSAFLSPTENSFKAQVISPPRNDDLLIYESK
ncbi:hypothetical protein CEUSTIGMA_g9643.t1 [Chlamydomonas eustigma]|uniref:Protein kinase domain-containing protein n=1 Tax=Chlamydomonas eustigma TaxID=1157962 RepID=A0A250XGL1_9CHLO|nr:hypothetical protein CEUSTIGMA_g9643.t1 [Chlamydomonas eustigma]|eukprot:GAX82215.1 hypothetical protein CEUSTIGMA_g9643.t1 [Chlamydomonas eustigma]